MYVCTTRNASQNAVSLKLYLYTKEKQHSSIAASKLMRENNIILLLCMNNQWCTATAFLQ